MRTHRSGVTAHYLGGARIRFTCPEGHDTVRDYSKGPAGHRLSEAGAHRLATAWDDRIRAPFICRKCPTQPPAERRRERLAQRAECANGKPGGIPKRSL
ncbi:MAG TPA: hypothetical protein VK911_00625 [Vicinamibacterales bacterium]|nr:hypothetical protein [Vicinamibacterales bacterium]